MIGKEGCSCKKQCLRVFMAIDSDSTIKQWKQQKIVIKSVF